MPGRPFLYGTTDQFLEHFGLNRIEDLPSISDIQSLVEKSVRKEDLLGVQKNIPISDEEEKDPRHSERSEESKNTDPSPAESMPAQDDAPCEEGEPAK